MTLYQWRFHCYTKGNDSFTVQNSISKFPILKTLFWLIVIVLLQYGEIVTRVEILELISSFEYVYYRKQATSLYNRKDNRKSSLLSWLALSRPQTLYLVNIPVTIMGMEFAGHLAFVTGGAGGIGAQVCQDLAIEGASVVVADRNAKAAHDTATSLPKGDGRKHLGVALDVSKKVEVDNALAEVIKVYGRPADLIVNCAGIAEDIASIKELEEDVLDRTMAVNFKGTFLVTQSFGKALLDANKPGSVVNISSLLAYYPMAGHAPYCASKAAVMQFSKVAAKEWGPKGIRVNSVHPGYIDTPMTRIHDKMSSHGEVYAKKASLQRIGKPKDVSDVVLFLLSNRSAFVTGTQLEVTGQYP